MSKKTTSNLINTTGKRRKAVAHATIREGTGTVRVNSIAIEHYGSAMERAKIMEPVRIAGDISKLKIEVSTRGGGTVGQADAARLAIARALLQHNKKLEDAFLDYDRTLLVADVRFKEPSKPNKHGKARAATQKSYR